MNGTVASIFIASAAGEIMTRIEQARLVVERGIEGDRYYLGVGSFSRWPGSGRDITFIEQETIDAILREKGLDLSAGQSRRNVVTTGIGLSDLNGQFFRIGSALLHGARECAPCKYLERLVRGAFTALKRCGGLRAEVIEGGMIAAGDEIEIGRQRRRLL